MTKPPSSWPPPPAVTAPLAGHDEFFIACIRNWTPKKPILRLQLAGKLRRETGEDLRFCQAVVNNFCDRHAILVPERGLIVWSPILLHLVMITMRAAVDYVLEQRHDAARTHIERVMITAEKRQLDVMLIGVWVTLTFAGMIWAFWRQRRTREKAAEAKAMFGGVG